MAELLQVAAIAFGLAGFAHLAAVVDELVREIDPAALRDDPHQFLLDFLGRIAFGQPKSVGDAEDMRIHHHAFGLLEADAKDDVGCLARRAGNGNQFGEGLRNLTAEVFNDFAGCALYGFGLVVKKASSPNESLEFRQGRFGHGRRGREAAEQLRRHHVDAHIGALSGENRGDEQFPGRAMVECALDVGIGFVESFEDGRDAVGCEVAARGLCGGGFARWLSCGHIARTKILLYINWP